MNGLNFETAKPIIYDSAKKSRYRIEDFCIALSSTIGLIIGIAVVRFSFHQMAELQLEPSGVYEFKNGVFTEMKAPNLPKVLLLFFLAMGAVPFFITVVTRLAGCIVRYVQAHFPTSEKFCEDLSEGCKKDAPIANSKIIPLLNFVNENAHSFLLEKMNFFQLNEARKSIGDRKFEKYIQGVRRFDHSLWRQIFELKKNIESPGELERALNSPQFKKVNLSHPGFWFGIYQIFGADSKYRAVLLKQMLSKIQTQKESDATTVVEIGNRKKAYNTSLLKTNSAFFAAMLTHFYEGTSGTAAFKEDYFHILDLLTGNKTVTSPEELIEILPQISYLQVDVLINPVEEMLINNVFDFDEETQIEIAAEHSYLKRFQAHLEEKFLSVGISDRNWEVLLEQSRHLQSHRMRKTMHDEAIAQVKANQG